jgi:hypothetical protein
VGTEVQGDGDRGVLVEAIRELSQGDTGTIVGVDLNWNAPQSARAGHWCSLSPVWVSW